MNPRALFRVLSTVLLVLALGGATVTVAENDPDAVSRFYQVHYLTPGMVEILAKQACGGSFHHQWCKMSWGSEGFVELTAKDDQQDQFAAALAERDVPPATQIFQVHLLRASATANSMPQLPIEAVHALEDLQQLLPYKGFTLVDSGLMRTSGRAQLFLGSERRYQAELDFEGDPVSGKPLQIEFGLQAEQIMKGDEGQDVVTGRVRLLGTTFSMNVGETVVVGTSKLNGGSEALVVLLSAGKSRR
jgi:hypothetical protein